MYYQTNSINQKQFIMKVSYHKRFSTLGTVYEQAISLKRKEYCKLIDALAAEVALNYPRRLEYVNGNVANLAVFGEGLEYDRSNGIVYCSLSQIRFFNLFLKLDLKVGRNTCLLIRN